MNTANPSGLLQIDAPHYCAACDWENGRCVKAAPILAWMIGKKWDYIHRWLFNKRYHWEWVTEHD